MRQAQRKKEKDKIAVALMLAFCVIALTSVFTIKSNIDKINDSAAGNLPVSDQLPADEPKTSPPEKTSAGDNSPQAKDDSQVSAQVPVVDSAGKSGQPEADGQSDSSGFINPVRSDEAYVTNEFSIHRLIYSVTLDQYMTHCGLDIEAPEDTQVVALSSGTVTAVYEDDRYGTSVEITHDDGLVTIYSNLSTAEMVETGDTVTAGQIIGGVGSSGLFESLEPAHLHLEMLKDGVYVDPAEYIRFNQ